MGDEKPLSLFLSLCSLFLLFSPQLSLALPLSLASLSLSLSLSLLSPHSTVVSANFYCTLL